MRSLDQFSLTEWLQLLPVQHLLKQARNDAWQAIYPRSGSHPAAGSPGGGCDGLMMGAIRSLM